MVCAHQRACQRASHAELIAIAVVKVCGFPPIAAANSRVLILGTMPGKESLRKQQYYAHPQNAFWKIAAEVFGFDAASSYESRVSSLAASGVAIWDVLKSCTREGSLDSHIEKGTVVPNDFFDFFEAHPHIHKVCFNGVAAENFFKKQVRPLLAGGSKVEYLRLPSTSPAHAAIPYAEKLRAWHGIANGI